MKNKIVLNVDHNNAKRMEFFLNQVDATLEEKAFEWQGMHLAERIRGGCKFTSLDQSLAITVLFCDSYSDANEIAKANAFPVSPKARWSVNGDLLYIVESDDEEKVSEILSLFAGRE